MQLKQLYIDDFKTAHFLDYALEVFCKNYLPELFRFMVKTKQQYKSAY